MWQISSLKQSKLDISIHNNIRGWMIPLERKALFSYEDAPFLPRAVLKSVFLEIVLCSQFSLFLI